MFSAKTGELFSRCSHCAKTRAASFDPMREIFCLFRPRLRVELSGMLVLLPRDLGCGHVSCPICGRHIIKATDFWILWTALRSRKCYLVQRRIAKEARRWAARIDWQD